MSDSTRMTPILEQLYVARGELDELITREAERREIDLQSLKLTLNGLEHLGYVRNNRGWYIAAKSAPIWWRTPKGDEAIA